MTVEMEPQETKSASGRQSTHSLGLYFGALTLVMGLGRPDCGLAQYPIQFFLKERLHLSATANSAFMLQINLPFFFGFLFGFIRDRWQPFGLGDRGYLLLATPVAVVTYLWLATTNVTYPILLAGMMLAAAAFQFLMAAAQGPMTVEGQSRHMTGSLGALWWFAYYVPSAVAALIGGYLAGYGTMRITLTLAAVLTGLIVALACREPAALAHDKTAMRPAAESGSAAVLRLIRHRPLWPATAIMFLWTFSPGWDTPLLYFLTDKFRFTDAMYGSFEAWQYGATALAIAFYGFLCRRYSLRRLLWIGTALGTMAGPLFLTINGPHQALYVAIIVGLFSGIAVATYMDLLYRSCPKHLEGTATAIGGAAFFVALYFGDLLGSRLYDKGGFPLAMAATTVSSALVFAFLPFLPGELTMGRDRQA